MVALSVVALMLLMAGVGLTWALMTVAFRRANDFPQRQDVAVPVLRRVPPLELAGLAYLPDSCQIVAGVHVADALLSPGGREFVERFRPGAFLLPQRQADEVGLDSLEKWIGLRLDEIDHLVLGWNVDRLLPPKLFIVVQAQREYDATGIRTALKAVRDSSPGKKVLYRVKSEQPPLDVVLWFAGPRTLVVGTTPEDLQEAPLTPQGGVAHLLPTLRTAIDERVLAGTHAWVAGHSEDWMRTQLGFLLKVLPKQQDRDALARVRTFAATVQLEGGLAFGAAFECGSDAGAVALEQYLLPPGAERRPLRLLGTGPRAQAVASELAQSLRAERRGPWVTLQAKAGEETVRQSLAAPGP